MFKSHSEPVFALIKSLSKSEKRFFKLHTSRGGEQSKNYVQLFDVLDKAKAYNDEKVRSKLPQIAPHQLANTKAHLYSQILQALRVLNSNDAIEIQLREQLDYAQILYDKCLYDQCQKVLNKAKSKAREFELSRLEQEVVEFEKQLSTKLIRSDIEKRVNDLMVESVSLQTRQTSIDQFSNLSMRLYSLYLKIGFIRNEKDLELANSFLSSTLPDFDEEQLSFDEKMYLYNAMTGYYFFVQETAKGYAYAKKWVALFDEQPKLILSKVEMYIRGVHNLLMAQSKLSKYDEFVETAEKFELIAEIPKLKLNKNLELQLFKYSSTHQINRYFMIGDFATGSQIIPEIAASLDDFVDQLDTHYKLIFYYKFACMYFGNSDYQNAIHWLNQIINEKDVDLRSDILCFARILNLISHFELGHAELLDYNIVSTYRFLIKKDDLHLFQKTIMKFLRSLQNITTHELSGAFTELREQLIPLTTSPYDKRAFIYFDIISWLESKIDKRDVGTVIREKALKRVSRSGSKAIDL